MTSRQQAVAAASQGSTDHQGHAERAQQPGEKLNQAHRFDLSSIAGKAQRDRPRGPYKQPRKPRQKRLGVWLYPFDHMAIGDQFMVANRAGLAQMAERAARNWVMTMRERNKPNTLSIVMKPVGGGFSGVVIRRVR